MCAGNVGTIEAIMITSAPVKRAFTSVVTDVTITSSSPAIIACSAIGLALTEMNSALTPCFFSKPFS
jgi:hypothetical protein